MSQHHAALAARAFRQKQLSAAQAETEKQVVVQQVQQMENQSPKPLTEFFGETIIQLLFNHIYANAQERINLQQQFESERQRGTDPRNERFRVVQRRLAEMQTQLESEMDPTVIPTGSVHHALTPDQQQKDQLLKNWLREIGQEHYYKLFRAADCLDWPHSSWLRLNSAALEHIGIPSETDKRLLIDHLSKLTLALPRQLWGGYSEPQPMDCDLPTLKPHTQSESTSVVEEKSVVDRPLVQTHRDLPPLPMFEMTPSARMPAMPRYASTYGARMITSDDRNDVDRDSPNSSNEISLGTLASAATEQQQLREQSKIAATSAQPFYQTPSLHNVSPRPRRQPRPMTSKSAIARAGFPLLPPLPSGSVGPTPATQTPPQQSPSRPMMSAAVPVSKTPTRPSFTPTPTPFPTMRDRIPSFTPPRIVKTLPSVSPHPHPHPQSPPRVLKKYTSSKQTQRRHEQLMEVDEKPVPSPTPPSPSRKRSRKKDSSSPSGRARKRVKIDEDAARSRRRGVVPHKWVGIQEMAEDSDVEMDGASVDILEGTGYVQPESYRTKVDFDRTEARYMAMERGDAKDVTEMLLHSFVYDYEESARESDYFGWYLSSKDKMTFKNEEGVCVGTIHGLKKPRYLLDNDTPIQIDIEQGRGSKKLIRDLPLSRIIRRLKLKREWWYNDMLRTEIVPVGTRFEKRVYVDLDYLHQLLSKVTPRKRLLKDAVLCDALLKLGARGHKILSYPWELPHEVPEHVTYNAEDVQRLRETLAMFLKPDSLSGLYPHQIHGCLRIQEWEHLKDRNHRYACGANHLLFTNNPAMRIKLIADHLRHTIASTDTYGHSLQPTGDMDKIMIAYDGGILGDDHGMGKTLTVLSSIMAGYQQTEMTPVRKTRGNRLLTNATLVVTPRHTIRTWMDEIALHFRPSAVSAVVLDSMEAWEQVTAEEILQAHVVFLSAHLITDRDGDNAFVEQHSIKNVTRHWKNLCRDTTRQTKNRGVGFRATDGEHYDEEINLALKSPPLSFFHFKRLVMDEPQDLLLTSILELTLECFHSTTGWIVGCKDMHKPAIIAKCAQFLAVRIVTEPNVHCDWTSLVGTPIGGVLDQILRKHLFVRTPRSALMNTRQAVELNHDFIPVTLHPYEAAIYEFMKRRNCSERQLDDLCRGLREFPRLKMEQEYSVRLGKFNAGSKEMTTEFLELVNLTPDCKLLTEWGANFRQKSLIDLALKRGSKIVYAIELVSKLMLENESNRVIVFGQSGRMLSTLVDLHADLGIGQYIVRYPFANNGQRECFTMGKGDNVTRVVCISSDDPSSGLNLVFATHLVILDSAGSSEDERMQNFQEAIAFVNRGSMRRNAPRTKRIVWLSAENTIEREYHTRGFESMSSSVDTDHLSFDVVQAAWNEDS